MLSSASVTISDTALTKAIALRQELGHPQDWGVRVAVNGGGCSGFMYDIEFCAPGGLEGDRQVEYEGLTLYIDRKSYLFLIGTELGWEENFMKKGFVFNNPNVTATCGCGESIKF